MLRLLLAIRRNRRQGEEVLRRQNAAMIYQRIEPETEAKVSSRYRSDAMRLLESYWSLTRRSPQQIRPGEEFWPRKLILFLSTDGISHQSTTNTELVVSSIIIRNQLR